MGEKVRASEKVKDEAPELQIALESLGFARLDLNAKQRDCLSFGLYNSPVQISKVQQEYVDTVTSFLGDYLSKLYEAAKLTPSESQCEICPYDMFTVCFKEPLIRRIREWLLKGITNFLNTMKRKSASADPEADTKKKRKKPCVEIGNESKKVIEPCDEIGNESKKVIESNELNDPKAVNELHFYSFPRPPDLALGLVAYESD